VTDAANPAATQAPGILAQSCWLYRLHRLPLVGPPEEEVWYFAYGANMHDSAFCGWRGMRPLDWRPGRVRGFRLRFNLEGRPRGKAAPANLFADPEAEVWGVLYRLTRRDLVRLDATEGIPWSWYRPLWLDAEDINGHPFRAMTYIAHGKEVDSRPSLRYITLLRDGARWRSRPSGYALGLRAHHDAKRGAATYVNCGGGADGHIPIYLAGREAEPR
jgi:cation transport regulator ChaC